jgi:hypothetical protein
MYQSSEIELWNLTPNVPVFLGAQDIFNVLGRLKSPDQVDALLYSLNGSPEKPVFFKSVTRDCERLERAGEFNIDTINVRDLRVNNSLTLRIVSTRSQEQKYLVDFRKHSCTEGEPHFRLKMGGVKYAQEVGQIVDGKWRVGCDESGEPCLEISREDTGYDRIILFGSKEWTCGYEVTARVCVTAWTGIQEHGLGLAFKWNPHLQGDGTRLPFEWNTGVGMYYSKAAGLRSRPGVRLAFGVTADNGAGRKFNHYLLKQKPLSLWRKQLARISQCIFSTHHLFPQIPPNKQYRFRLTVRPEQFALTLWREGKKEPLPQLDLLQPVDRLPRGSVGIIAHNCAVRVYEFAVSPIRSIS